MSNLSTEANVTGISNQGNLTIGSLDPIVKDDPTFINGGMGEQVA